MIKRSLLTFFFFLVYSAATPALTLTSSKPTIPQPGCYIIENNGHDTYVSVTSGTVSGEKATRYFGTWRGQEGRYLVIIKQTDSLIELNSLDPSDKPFTAALNPCPSTLPQAAAQQLTSGIDQRLHQYFGQENDLNTAHQLMQKALHGFQAATEPRWYAQTAFELASLETQFGNIAAAIENYQLALQMYRRLNDESGESAALNLLGLKAKDQGQLSQAESAFTHALSIRQRLGQTHQAASILSNLALLASQKGQAAEASAYYERALSAFQGSADFRAALHRDTINTQLQAMGDQGDLPSVIRTLNNLAVHYDSVGQEDIAERYWLNALILSRYTQQAAVPAQIQTNLGRMLLQQGRSSEALKLLLEACSQFNANTDPRWRKVCLTYLSQTYAFLGDFNAAQTQIDLALNLPAGESESTARAWWYQGELYQAQQQWQQAQSAYQHAAEAFEKVGMQFQVEQIHSSLAQVALEQGHIKAAIQQQTQAIAALHNMQRLREEARARVHLGSTFWAIGAQHLARRHWQQALNDHRTVKDTFAQLQTLELLARHANNRQQQRRWDRELIAVTEGIRNQDLPAVLQAQFFARQRSAFERLIASHIAEESPAQAWQVAERARARGFTERRQNRQQWLSVLNPNQVKQYQQRQQLLNQRTEWLQRLHGLKLDHNTSAPNTLSAELRQAEDELLRIEQALARTDSSNPIKPLRLSHLQAELSPKQAVLSYFLGEQDSVLWLIQHDSIQSWPMPSAAKVQQQVNQLRQQLQNPSRAPGAIYRKADQLAAQILPPPAVLGGINELIIQADGALHALPFSLLSVNKAPLSQHWQLRYAPASALVLAAKRDLDTAAITAVADPLWQQQGDESVFTQLPGTREEVHNLSTLQQQYLPDWSFASRLGRDASRDFILAGGLNSARIIHIATHGLADRQYPQLSALVFSDDENGQPSLLWPQEIANLHLSAALVTLSGCETGDGKIIAGEGSLNLARPFLLAGADSVLASLWKVNDSRSVAFMAQFYQHLLVDRWPASRALAETQRWAQKQTLLAHPYYWASYILLGQEVQPQTWPSTPITRYSAQANLAHSDNTHTAQQPFAHRDH